MELAEQHDSAQAQRIARFLACTFDVLTFTFDLFELRALAVTSRARNPALPETPTMIEAGLQDFEVVGFYGVLAPAGTPAAAVERLSAAFKATLETPDVRTRMVTQGADPAFLGSADFGRFLQGEMPRWADAVKRSGARLD